MSKTSTEAVGDAELDLNYLRPDMYLKNAYQSCVISFDYFIQTSSDHQIEVRFGADLASWSSVYSVSHNSTGTWHRAFAHIGEVFGSFMVSIKGHLAEGSTFDASALALDNIHFSNCALPRPLPSNVTKCPLEGQFLCHKYRFCIEADALCNNVNDCGNGEDEMECSAYPSVSCNFEDTLQACALSTVHTEASTDDSHKSATAFWSVFRAGNADPSGYLPKIDNTR